ncbi:MAG: tyrosine-type recombinase/integrase [Clostridiales bacterium]|nr:tyrosine-type recombinase/integrase [Clostridiales bacterium]
MLDRSMCPDLDNLIRLDDDLRSAVITAMNKRYLDMHKGSIWPDTNKNLWCTKLNGKNLTCKTRQGLEQKLITYYKSLDQSFYRVMTEQLAKNLSLKSIKPNTVDRYRDDYERYVKGSILDQKAVPETTANHVRKFLETQIIQGISKKNFDNLIGLLNVVYFYSELTDINVCAIKRLMKVKSKQFSKSNRRPSSDVVWTDEEQAMLIQYGDRVQDIRALGLVFMLQTGLAISELTQLHRADIDIPNRELTVKRIETKHKVDGKTVYGVSQELTAKTDTRLDPILLTQKAMDTYKKILALSKATTDDDCIFNGYKSYSFNDYLRRHVLPDLGLTGKNLHSLRKTYATNLIDAGIPVKIVQLQMRHADIQTTYRYYYKRKSTKEEALSMLDNVS